MPGIYNIKVFMVDGTIHEKDCKYDYDINWELDMINQRLFEASDAGEIEKIECTFDGNNLYIRENQEFGSNVIPTWRAISSPKQNFDANRLNTPEEIAKAVLNNFGVAWMANYTKNGYSRQPIVRNYIETLSINPTLHEDEIMSAVEDIAWEAYKQYTFVD